jgi:hypothetical protein
MKNYPVAALRFGLGPLMTSVPLAAGILRGAVIFILGSHRLTKYGFEKRRKSSSASARLFKG